MHLVIIGGVAAGMSAASRARRLDRDLSITVFESGPVVSYGACGLPYWIGGGLDDAAELVVHPPAFFESERNIRVRTNTPVAEIVPARRRIFLQNGEEVPYDRLVIATGARARIPGIPGVDAPHSFVFRTWEDAHRLQAFLASRKPRTAAIVGAGFVGLELAEALHARGLQVTLIDQSSHFLGWRDEWLSGQIIDRVRRAGVDLRLGHTVQEIRESSLHAAALDSSENADIPAELVVLAPGVAPAVDLAERSGIRLGRSGAIAVDDYLETSCTGIFAAGDCAETRHILLDAPTWLPLGTTANKMGRVAGANVIGKRERFPGVVGTAIVRVFGMGVAVTGLSDPEAQSAGFQPVSATITSKSRASYFSGQPLNVKLVAERNSGRLLGGTVTGEDGVEGRINVLATAITARMTLEDFQFTDLCYAPPYATVWDPLLIAAQQLLKKIG